MDIIFNISNKDDFEKVTEDILNCLLNDNQFEPAITLSENDFNTVKDAVKNILVETYCDSERIDLMLNEKNFNKELINIFCSSVSKRKDSFLLLFLLQHNSTFGETVVTFDWLVKLVCGTSELKSLKYPLMQLAITTINKKQVYKHRSYDISKDMLIKLIDVLENIQ